MPQQPVPQPSPALERRSAPCHAAPIASVACAAGVLVAAATGAGAAAVVAALSFWHYWVYWLAYRYGAVEPAVFRRDAMLLKAVSLVALGWAYFSAPLDWLSLAVIAAGFGLNALGAAALGPERTYYGHELARLPALRVRAFPYSVISHPMLIGNVIAYGGTLLNAEFRAAWWPLACAHVLLNLGLLAMETRVTPLRRAANGVTAPAARQRGTLPGVATVAAVTTGAAALALALRPEAMPAYALLGLCVAVHAYTLARRYAWPSFRSPASSPCQKETVT